MEFEESFNLVGNFGRFQFLCAIILCLNNIAFGTQMLLMVIVGADPDKSIPSEANLTTIVTEWNLQGEEWVVDLMNSLFMAGYIAGMIIFGQLPDLFGRKLLLIATFTGLLTCSFSAAFCRNWKTFAVARFCGGMFTGVASPTNYVWVCELIGKMHWGRMTLMLSMFFPFGILALSGLGYTLQNWKMICIVVSAAPLILLPLHIFVIPESPRWLYSVGKFVKAEKVLSMIARRNGKTDVYITLPRGSSSKEGDLKKHTIIDLFRVRKFFNQLLMCCVLWFASSLLYYGLTLDLSDLAPNVYLAIILSGSSEIPAFILVLLIIDRKWFGRRGSIMPLLLICAAAITGLVFLDATSVTISTSKTVLGLIGKLCVAGVFSLLFLYTSELFPTQLRVVSVGTSSICARVGAIIAPFVPLLTSFAPYLPYMVFAIGPIVAAFVLLFLPETLGRDLPKMPSLDKDDKNVNASTLSYQTFSDDESETFLQESSSSSDFQI